MIETSNDVVKLLISVSADLLFAILITPVTRAPHANARYFIIEKNY